MNWNSRGKARPGRRNQTGVERKRGVLADRGDGVGMPQLRYGTDPGHLPAACLASHAPGGSYGAMSPVAGLGPTPGRGAGTPPTFTGGIPASIKTASMKRAPGKSTLPYPLGWLPALATEGPNGRSLHHGDWRESGRASPSSRLGPFRHGVIEPTPTSIRSRGDRQDHRAA
jgi:hypothetical protein